MKDGQCVTLLREVLASSYLEVSFAALTHGGPVNGLRITIDGFDVTSMTLTSDQATELATALLMARTALLAEAKKEGT